MTQDFPYSRSKSELLPCHKYPKPQVTPLSSNTDYFESKQLGRTKCGPCTKQNSPKSSTRLTGLDALCACFINIKVSFVQLSQSRRNVVYKIPYQ